MGTPTDVSPPAKIEEEEEKREPDLQSLEKAWG